MIPSARPSARIAVLAVCLASGVGSAFEQKASTLPLVVQRFLERDRADEPVTSYTALRRLEAHNTRYQKHGWIDARTTIDQTDGFQYEIVGEGGSSYIREKVLRRALEHEAKAHAAAGRAAIVPVNYDFGTTTTDRDGLVSIPLKPKRKDTLLLEGALFLTPADADLVRVEGVMAKTPSFWIRRVEVVRRYGRIGAVRVPLAVESTAHVLMAGESTFTMRYEYASINGREVGQPLPGPVASASFTSGRTGSDR